MQLGRSDYGGEISEKPTSLCDQIFITEPDCSVHSKCNQFKLLVLNMFAHEANVIKPKL